MHVYKIRRKSDGRYFSADHGTVGSTYYIDNGRVFPNKKSIMSHLKRRLYNDDHEIVVFDLLELFTCKPSKVNKANL